MSGRGIVLPPLHLTAMRQPGLTTISNTGTRKTMILTRSPLDAEMKFAMTAQAMPDDQIHLSAEAIHELDQGNGCACAQLALLESKVCWSSTDLCVCSSPGPRGMLSWPQAIDLRAPACTGTHAIALAAQPHSWGDISTRHSNLSIPEAV